VSKFDLHEVYLTLILPAEIQAIAPLERVRQKRVRRSPLLLQSHEPLLSVKILFFISNHTFCAVSPSCSYAYSCFRQRFDIKHIFRFGKQRLLMTQFQTPDVKHEENCIHLVMLAYVQLWAAKDLASHLPRPWERYLKPQNDKIVTQSVVQRDFHSLISEIGKPGHSPKPRGNSNGRVAGHSQPKRSKHPVVKKQ